jgi:hypothetical protein
MVSDETEKFSGGAALDLKIRLCSSINPGWRRQKGVWETGC